MTENANRNEGGGPVINWRTYLPHWTISRIGVLVIQIVGGRRWSLSIFIKPKQDNHVDQ